MKKKNNKRPPKEIRWNAPKAANLDKRTEDLEKQQGSIQSDASQTPVLNLSQIKSSLAKNIDQLRKWKDAPIHSMHVCVLTQDKALAREIEGCKIYPTDIDCKLAKADVERMRPTLCKYVFSGNPSTDEILRALSCNAVKPLSVEDVRYLAFFLEMLKEKGIISRWWQKAYIEAKAFAWKGKPVGKFSDRLRDAKDDFCGLKLNPNKLTRNQEKRLQAYQNLEMLCQQFFSY